MTENLGSPQQDSQSAAAEWVIRLQGAETAENDWLEFDLWLDSDADHGPSYDRALALWLELDALAKSAPPAQQPSSDNVVPMRSKAWSTPAWQRWIAAGAAAAAALVAVWLIPPAGRVAPQWQTIQTAKGEQRSITLADGSRLDLAAASTLSYAFDGHIRRVKMSGGEALFDVAKDDQHPFVIEVADRSVKVIGTAFDIRQRGDHLSVAVQRGEVAVAPLVGGAAVHLLPGKRIDHQIGSSVEQLSDVATDEMSSWRSGRLIYRDRPLTELVYDLNSQFDRPVTLADARLGEIKFSGVLVLDDQDSVIHRLTLLTPLWSSSSAAGIVLRAKEASAQ